jgi:aminoglycoside phosphotransferase
VADDPATPIPAPPPSVIAIAAGRPLRLAWCNELGGLTFEIGAGRERCFVKWMPATAPVDLGAERARLAWAAAFVSVPVVLDHGSDGDGAWMLTRALPGDNAVAERWRSEPATAVAAIGSGLRAFHDALPVAACPFSWSIERRLADIRRRAEGGRIRPEAWHPLHGDLTIDSALALLAKPPPVDQLVVCHGDTCAPNTLIDEGGRCCGHVDLGALGVADRWADLAIATWSTQWNYGPGWEGALLDAYGALPDQERTRYYRLLWDLGP